MRLFRTITFKEFTALFFEGKILSREQKASVCVRYLDGREVSAAEEPFEAVCTFSDKLFWAKDYDETSVIMLELEIPEERVLWTGYGIYSAHFFNNHFDKECSWITMGEYGLARLGLRDYKIPETYISSYSKDDIVSVYFMNGCNISHSLKWREDFYGFEDCLFGDYVYYLLKFVSNYFVKKGETILERGARRQTFEWVESIPDLKNGISLRTFKKKLISHFPESEDFVNKFQYFNSAENLESLISKGNVNYECSLNPMRISSLVDSLYNEVYGLRLVNLESREIYPEIVNLTLAKVLKRVDTTLTAERISEVKSLIYTLMLDNKILSR